MPLPLNAKSKDLGGFSVKRILPHEQKPAVGPFVFFDHMGPADFPAGQGINVRPHPHIGLATITYLFEGAILHRDSLGNVQEIVPGDVNWMTAGRGIVHSERETLEVRGSNHRTHGLQVWVALPEELAEIDPDFTHVKQADLPHVLKHNLMIRVVAGEAYGLVAPIVTHTRLCYLDVLASGPDQLELPTEHEDLAVYLQWGEIKVGDNTYSNGEFLVLDSSERKIEILDTARFMVLGGEKLPRKPHVYWNFVAYDRDRIERAKKDWKDGNFPQVPGDDQEFIPLPD